MEALTFFVMLFAIGMLSQLSRVAGAWLHAMDGINAFARR